MFGTRPVPCFRPPACTERSFPSPPVLQIHPCLICLDYTTKFVSRSDAFKDATEERHVPTIMGTDETVHRDGDQDPDPEDG